MFQRGGCKIIQFFNWMKKDGGRAHFVHTFGQMGSILGSQNPRIPFWGFIGFNKKGPSKVGVSDPPVINGVKRGPPKDLLIS